VILPGWYRARRASWMSNKLKGGMKNHPIEFKAYFAAVNRIKAIKVLWNRKPKEMALRVSLDKTIFYDVVDWEDASGSFDFAEPLYMAGFKILMKGATSEYIGFNAVDAIFEPLTMQIHPISEEEHCWARASPQYYTENTYIQVMDCIEAIGLGDGREIFEL
jgi:hypothetical protein